ncbi:MAG: hypothetical protein IJT94_01970 [Oscillibacter sp.]|nr:hypothetical protein [Oscillibacter sp.]
MHNPITFDGSFLYLPGLDYGVKLSWVLLGIFMLILTVPRWISCDRNQDNRNIDNQGTFNLKDYFFRLHDWPSRHRSTFRILLLALSGLLCYFLPVSAGSVSAVSNWVDTILKMEIPSAILLLFLLAWTLSYREDYGNRSQYLGILEWVGMALLFVFTASNMAGRVLLFTPATLGIRNVIWLIYLWGCVLYLDETRKRTPYSVNDRKLSSAKDPALSQDPINQYDSLFEERKKLADNLISILESPFQSGNSDFDTCSICVTGKWGAGKTSVVNGALSKLMQKHPEYTEIRVNALEFGPFAVWCG